MWGTPDSNMQDTLDRGRLRKLFATDVHRIRELLGTMSRKEIALKFNVAVVSIHHIATGRTWSRV